MTAQTPHAICGHSQTETNSQKSEKWYMHGWIVSQIQLIFNINCSQKVRKLFSIWYICYYLILFLYMVCIIAKLNSSSIKWYHSCNDYMLLDLTTLMRMRQSHKSNVPKLALFLCYCMNWQCNSNKQDNLLILIHLIETRNLV